jgi:hypothetical protein
MKLVHNARQSWRWFSIWAMTLQGAAGAAWLSVPDDMRAAVPPAWLAYAAVALTVLGIAGRLIDQERG